MAAAAENLVCWHIQYLVSTYLQCLVSGVSTVSGICITFGGQPTLALVRVTWSMHFQTTCIHRGSWFLMVYVFRYFYSLNMLYDNKSENLLVLSRCCSDVFCLGTNNIRIYMPASQTIICDVEVRNNVKLTI